MGSIRMAFGRRVAIGYHPAEGLKGALPRWNAPIQPVAIGYHPAEGLKGQQTGYQIAGIESQSATTLLRD